MIDLSGFSDLVPKSGRYSADSTYIRITGSRCKLVLGKGPYEEVRRHFGATVNIKVNGDASILAIVRGADRRIGSANRDVSLLALRDRLKEAYGSGISCIYLSGSWDDDERGGKVYVLRADGRREYHADATTRKLRG